ncbi:hypothetical protein [Methanoregula sp.]|jgi:hypothetical protein|uniref:hypothetical protein n=1 Tax=Methanoregula sp. TaxID=2052170 RepID=UPI003C1485A0
MRTGIPVILILTVTLLAAGCIQLPGVHILTNGPDPVIGQWVGGELPASDLHVILFENRTYLSRSFYLGQGDRVANGTWSRPDNGLILLQENSGNITSWMYDPSDDSIYLTGLPQRKYYRFKG